MTKIAKKYQDISGKVFTRLTVSSETYSESKGKIYWNCVCLCGNNVSVEIYSLLSGNTKSCGCLQKDIVSDSMKKHALWGTRTYNIHQNILKRCLDETNVKYADYGGRGITVCDRWNPSEGGSFQNFLEDMGECPSNNLEIDRVDNNQGYFRENCRWVTRSENLFNRRKSSKNKSGRTGVYWNDSLGKYRVSIRKDGIEKHLGVFSSFEDACEARSKAEIELYGYTKE